MAEQSGAIGVCGRPALGVLPLPAAHGETQFTIDWTRCQGHGLCARLVPELVQLDEHGYPELLDAPVPFWLSRDAKQAVDMCPALALSLTRIKAEPGPSALPAPAGAPVPVLRSRSTPGPTKRVKQDADLAVTTTWIAELGDGRPD